MHHGAAMMSARDTAGSVAPTAPSNPAANQLTSTSVRVSWDDNSTNEDNFLLYRGVNGASLSLYQTLSANTTSYDDTGLTEGDTYCYKVSAKNESGESSKTAEVCETPVPAAPDAPTDFSLSTGTASDELDASWTDNSDNEDNFEIVHDGTVVATVGENVESTTITGLDPRTFYGMTVRAVNEGGSSSSNLDTASTRLEKPQNLTKNVTGDGTEFENITLNWDAVTDAVDYQITKDGSDFVTTTQTQYSVPCDNATGTWRVVAQSDTVPDSQASDPVSHTCS